jgi:hypothetical protein
VANVLVALQNSPNNCGFVARILWHKLGSSAASRGADIKDHDYRTTRVEEARVGHKRDAIKAVRDEPTPRKPARVRQVFASIYGPTPYFTVVKMPFHWGLGDNCFANVRSVGASVCTVCGLDWQIGLFQFDILPDSHMASTLAIHCAEMEHPEPRNLKR